MNYIFYGIFALVCIISSGIVAGIVSKIQKNKWRADTNAVFIKNIEAAQAKMKEIDTELDLEVDENEVDIKQLQKDMKKHSRLLKELVENVVENEQEIADQLGHFTGEIFNLKQALDGRISQVARRVTENDSEIESNDKDISKLQKKDVSIKDDGKALFELVAELETKVAKLKKDVNDLDVEEGCCEKEDKPNKKPSKKNK